ncbi:hypothetical protein HQ945_08345 [Phyllobacterium sp. BT25]|uniref:Organic solvent tolerance-like N-terminal domain-containing protein n=1 Tax=Phyllobacterium pellucidum TaxID=2740464 RepID=A0A849VTS8_9HYPH|nr:hypothetical protein [Phyllobacterium pellucidum]NTS31263.1 hypothetical protein [Phyllobacterium pellucidum]
MRAILLGCFVALATLPATAKSNAYTCSNFVNDLSAIRAGKSVDDPQVDGRITITMGYLMGAYAVATGNVASEQTDEKLLRYENAVLQTCKTSPELKPTDVAFRETKALPYKDAKSDATKSKYQQISFTDLKLDIGEMKGKMVEVSGRLSLFADMAILQNPDDKFSTNNIYVDTKKLTRDERKTMLTQCQHGCTVTVKGKIATGTLMQEGIAADTVVFSD